MESLKSTFTLPDYIVRELSQFSKELGKKKSHIVAEALMQYFDILDLKLAQKRSLEVHNGEAKTVSLEQIKKELGL